MKRLISLFATAIMIVSMIAIVPTISAGAETFGDWECAILDDGTIEISRYTGSDTEITIPSEIDGKSVTSIGEKAFRYHEKITSIDIPDSVTSIGDHAFDGCNNLTIATIPNSVTSIGAFAFDNCENLAVNIPDGVVSIGRYAFRSCRYFNSPIIIIPESVTEIGNKAIGYFTSLDSRYDITIYCEADSVAVQYAIDNYIDYVIVDNVNSLLATTEAPTTEAVTESDDSDSSSDSSFSNNGVASGSFSKNTDSDSKEEDSELTPIVTAIVGAGLFAICVIIIVIYNVLNKKKK